MEESSQGVHGGYEETYSEVAQNQGCHFAVPIRRVIVLGGVYWSPPI